MDAAMEKKLQELIDRQEIWAVMQRYGRGLDRIDRELVRSCYFDDAIEDHDTFVGKVDDFIEWANQSSLLFECHHHGLMNHFCDLKGSDAYCETYYLFTAQAAQPPHFMSMGRYIDHFQKRNGEWRIANRVCIVESNFELAPARFGTNVPSSYGPNERQSATRDRNDVSYHRPPRPRKPRPVPLKAAE
jgi:SnoaL-like domain